MLSRLVKIFLDSNLSIILILLSLVLYGGHHMSLQLLWIPVIAVIQFVFTLGFALIVSASC